MSMILQSSGARTFGNCVSMFPSPIFLSYLEADKATGTFRCNPLALIPTLLRLVAAWLFLSSIYKHPRQLEFGEIKSVASVA